MWAIARDLKIPLDAKINKLTDIPYTISYVIRKRIQVDSLYEFPKDKRPPDDMIWNSSSDELDSWLERVMSGKQKTKTEITISDDEIEG